MIVTYLIRTGDRRKIRAVAKHQDGKIDIPYREFRHIARRSNPQEWEKLQTLFKYVAEYGPPRNEQKFRQIIGYDGLFEFKTKSNRLFCFFDEGGLIICSTGYFKGGQKAPKQELERAQNWRQAYFQAKRERGIKHLPENLEQ